jgi:dimethylhistidine N-methyltransferase
MSSDRHRVVIHPMSADPVVDFAADVRRGLTSSPKELSTKYLYDAVGSALFEVISLLPEYGLTRADERLLRLNAHAMLARLPRPLIVAELGSGSGKKTRWLLEAACRSQPTSYYPIEISRTALAMCGRELAQIDAIDVVGFEREYLDGLREVAARRQQGQHLLVLFLGSTIGNFERRAAVSFLRELRLILQRGDSLLLGADLEKPIPQLLLAYDDPLGVTAAFNLNLLARINRELAGDFELRQFEHVVTFNAEARSIEMHLRSLRRQTVTIAGADLEVSLVEGETIWTESSRKFGPEELVSMAAESGFRCEAQWIDDDWPFAESLLIAQ